RVRATASAITRPWRGRTGPADFAAEGGINITRNRAGVAAGHRQRLTIPHDPSDRLRPVASPAWSATMVATIAAFGPEGSSPTRALCPASDPGALTVRGLSTNSPVAGSKR